MLNWPETNIYFERLVQRCLCEKVFAVAGQLSQRWGCQRELKKIDCRQKTE